MALETQLLQIIALLYRMTDDDEATLYNELLTARKRAWSQALREEVARMGCNQRPNAPRLEDLAELRDLSRQDAESIRATYNREMENALKRFYKANPRGNRRYYARNMGQWLAKRTLFKDAQIALQTEQTTRFYAQDRFRQMNGLRGGSYIFTGPAPVCKVCVKEFAQGVVTEQYIQRHPAPRHIGCPHEWTATTMQRIECGKLWVG